MVNQTDLFPLITLPTILLFTRKGPGKPENCFSRTNSNMIKGLMAIFVVLCHLSLIYPGGTILPVFEYLGDAAVGIFFFLSGYGLMKQYSLRNDYHIGFIQKRLNRVLIPYLIVNVIYWLYYLFIGERYGFTDLINSLKTGDLLVSYSWYIVEVLILYLFFYLFMRIDRKKMKYMIVSHIVLYLVLIFMFKGLNYAPYWYRSTYMYIIGLLYVVFEKQITAFIRNNYVICLGTAIITGLLMFIYKVPYYYFEIALLLAIILVFNRFELNNRPLIFLGRISLEIYLLHGLIIKFFRRFISTEASFLSLTLILFLIVSGSYLFNSIYNLIFGSKRNA